MTKEFLLNAAVNAIILVIVTIWVRFIGNKIIKVINEFELKLEKDFVKKKDFKADIDDAKEGRKNLWTEFRKYNKEHDEKVNDYALQFTKEVTELRTKIELKGN